MGKFKELALYLSSRVFMTGIQSFDSLKTLLAFHLHRKRVTMHTEILSL